MTYDEEGWDRPVARDPRAPGARPAHQRPTHQGPAYPGQAYPGPTQPGPAYRGPSYQQPSHQQPYQQPTYQQPTYQGPGYQQPGSGQVPEPSVRSGGATGNERLTAMTGAVLLILLLAEGFTILRIGRLLTVHFFIGMLLLGPVTLKAGSTIYRFSRYYTGHPEYRRKGPPAPLLRLIGPFIVLLTACVFGTGIMLAITGPAGRNSWLFLHKASFVLWFCAMAVHVLAYVPRLPRLLAREARGVGDPEDDGYATAGRYANRAAAALGGRGIRLTLLIGSLLGGLVIAMLTVHLAGQWQLQFPNKF